MKKIICGQFKQETNRYAPGVSDERAYRNREWFWGEEAIRAHYLSERTELSGFFDELDICEDCQLIPIMALNASPGPVTALVSYDYYPHTDCYETGRRAAKIMWQTITGVAKPVMCWHKLSMLFPFVNTDGGPIVPLLKIWR